MTTPNDKSSKTKSIETKKPTSTVFASNYAYRNQETFNFAKENKNIPEELSSIDKEGSTTKQSVTKILCSKCEKKDCKKKYLPETEIPRVNEKKKCLFNPEKIFEFLKSFENFNDKTILRFFFQTKIKKSSKNSGTQKNFYEKFFKKFHSFYINYNVYDHFPEEDPLFKVYRRTKEENEDDMTIFYKKLYEISAKIFMKKPNKPQKYYLSEENFKIVAESFRSLKKFSHYYENLYFLENQDKIQNNENFEELKLKIQSFHEEVSFIENENMGLISPKSSLKISVTICEYIFEEEIVNMVKKEDFAARFSENQTKLIEACLDKDFIENDFIYEIFEKFEKSENSEKSSHKEFNIEKIKHCFDESLKIFLYSFEKIFKNGEYKDLFTELIKVDGSFKKTFKNLRDIDEVFFRKYQNYLANNSNFEIFSRNVYNKKNENTQEKTKSINNDFNYSVNSTTFGNTTKTIVFTDQLGQDIEKIHRVFALMMVLEKEIKKKYFFSELYYYCFLYTYFNKLFDFDQKEKPPNNYQVEEIKNKIIFDSLLKSFKLHDFILNYEKEIATIYSPFLKDFQDNLEALLDGEFQSLLFCKKVPFLALQNLVVHPIALGIVSFYEKMKSYTKGEKNEKYYNDNNLPAITFINFDGSDHPNNYYFANSFAKHLQIISINIDAKKKHCIKIQETVKAMDSEKNQKHFYFFPLRSKGVGENLDLDFEIKDYDILSLFEKIIFKIIARHSPSLVVISHSFVFHKTINPEIRTTLKPATFQMIVAKLCLLSNFRVVLYPNIQIKSENSGYALKEDQTYGNWINKFSFSSQEDLWVNRAYIYEMIGAFFNAVYQKSSPLIEKKFSKFKHEKFNPFDNYMKEFSKKNIKKGLLCNFQEKLCKSDVSKGIVLKNKRVFNDIQEENRSLSVESSSKNKNGENFFSLGSYFSQVFELFDIQNSKMKLFSLKKLESDGNENIFYYNDQSVYYVHYEISKLFFFNVSSNDSLRNYEFDFSLDKFQKDSLIGKEIPFYFPKNKNTKNDHDISYLKDFSICATNSTIYIVYGLNVNKNKKNELFFGLLAYSIEKKEWRNMNIKIDKKILDLRIPRIRASSIAMQKTINGEVIDYIFIFGGTNFLGKGEDGAFDFLNDIEIYKIKNESNEAEFQKISKGKYKDTYKPLENSLIIPSISQSPFEFFIALIGGSYSPFLFNQNNTLSGYYVKINLDPNDSKDSFVEFTKFAKNQKNLLKKEYEKLDGLNAIFSSQSRNIYNKKKIFICPNILIQEKKGIFFDFSSLIHQTNSFVIDKNLKNTGKSLLKKKQELEFQKQLQYQIIFKKTAVIDLIHQSSMEGKFKYFMLGLYDAVMEKLEKDLMLISDDRPEIVFVKYKKTKKDTSKKDEVESVNYLEFSLSDVKNIKKQKGYLYEDYLPSNLKLNNYSKFDSKIYILINNSKDNNFKRYIYELNVNNIDFKTPKRFELIKVFEDLTAMKGSIILVESLDVCYILCGELAYKAKQEKLETINKNIMINLNTKKIMNTLPDNNKPMISPFAFLHNNHIICVNRFYSNIPNDHIYGEFLKLETKRWVSFKIFFEKTHGNIYYENEGIAKTYTKNVIVIEKIHSLGSINNSDFILVFLVEYKKIKIKKPTSNNLKRLIHLNIRNLSEKNKSAYSESDISEKNDITENDDAYYNIMDISENNDNPTVNFIDSSFQRTPYEYFEKKKNIQVWEGKETEDLENKEKGTPANEQKETLDLEFKQKN